MAVWVAVMAIWGVVTADWGAVMMTGGGKVVTGGDEAMSGGEQFRALQRAAMSPNLHAHLTPKIMAEYWQTVEERAQATIAVWQQHFASLTLGATDLAAFGLLTGALTTRAQERDNAVQTLDQARQARDFAAQSLRNATMRVPKIIEGRLEPESGLIDDLDKVYAIRPRSFDKILTRGRRLLPVWTAANGWLGSQVPVQPPIESGVLDVDDFNDALDAFGPLMQAVANAEERDNAGRDALNQESRDVEKLCIRFLSAASASPHRARPQRPRWTPSRPRLPPTCPMRCLCLRFPKAG